MAGESCLVFFAAPSNLAAFGSTAGRLFMRVAARMAAILLGGAGVGAAIAGPGYETALEACRVAAEAAEFPGEFKCDWKTVTRGAPGGALTGKYKSAEEGLEGSMTVLELPEGRVLVSAETVGGGDHTCSLGIEGKREDDAIVLKPDDVEGCLIRIRSGTKPNIVEVDSNEDCRSYYCGMRADFAGKWKLQSK